MLATQPGNFAIVDAVCGLSETLEGSVTAEGVETSEQCQMLGTLGVNYLQGFLFGPPLSVQGLEGLARARGGPGA